MSHEEDDWKKNRHVLSCGCRLIFKATCAGDRMHWAIAFEYCQDHEQGHIDFDPTGVACPTA